MELYEALGVKRGASATQIRRAWQRLSRALHPALNPGDPAAAQRYAAAAAAFEVLSDPERRAAYDRGDRPIAADAPPPAKPPRAPRSPKSPKPSGRSRRSRSVRWHV